METSENAMNWPVLILVFVGLLALSALCLGIAGWLEDNGGAGFLGLILYAILAGLFLWGVDSWLL